MRHRYLVSYDICDPKRLRRVHRIVRDYGDYVQDSVYLCELSFTEKTELEQKLCKRIQDQSDQVLLVSLGPASNDVLLHISSVGRKFVPCEKIMLF